MDQAPSWTHAMRLAQQELETDTQDAFRTTPICPRVGGMAVDTHTSHPTAGYIVGPLVTR